MSKEKKYQDILDKWLIDFQKDLWDSFSLNIPQDSGIKKIICHKCREKKADDERNL